MKIVIDMMGGDNGLKATIPGVKEFIKNHGDVDIFCIGSEALDSEFKDYKNVKVVHSAKVLKMDVDPMTAYRTLDSSLMVATNVFNENKCDALISAGSSGALMTASIFKIKRINGVIRPGFITSFPTVKKGKKFVVCDVGANNANTKEELVQFAQMGTLYYKFLYGENNPRVYLLSNGTEEEKGSPLTKDAYKLLKEEKSINFLGNTEGRDALFGDIDVLVCDGFSGNVFLKAIEGTAKAMSQMMKEAFTRNLFTKIGYLLSKKGIIEMKNKMDYKNVGGAMLVGIDGVVIKAHGNSDDKTFLSALNVAYLLCEKEFVKKFKEALK
jgi:glycerol-3-phosphate acyltransferase PlsX